jgi:predicted CoA-binding protein
MKVSKQLIDNFYKEKRIAIAGVSRNPKKFGYQVLNELTKKGYEILPVNPKASSINDIACYPEIENLPADVASLLILTPKDQTDDILKKAINKGIKNIWVQQMSETSDTLKIANEFNKEIIHHKCIFMFADGIGGIHKFHRTIVKLFGGLPK